MKKIVCLFITIILIIFPINSIYANENTNENDSQSQTLEEQQEEFGINEFIEQADEYSGEFFEDIDINQILENAIKGEVDNQTLWKKVLSLLGGELVDGLTVLASNVVV